MWTYSSQILNHLLAALPAEDLRRVSADLTLETLRPRQRLQKRDEPLCDIYFPGRSLSSLMITMADGSAAETIVVGPEGVVGIEAALGLRQAMCDATVQIAGDAVAYRIRVDAFLRELDRRGPFYTVVTNYAQAFVSFVAHSVACNGLHAVEARCCRWLLHAQDRLGTDQFPLTHDLLSTVLGVRRPTVTLIVGDLVRLGVLSTSRGRTRITDRQAMEARSCECYRTVKRVFDSTFPADASNQPDDAALKKALVTQPAPSESRPS